MRVLTKFDPWRSPLCTCPEKYSLHPYTGCSHFCLYCYATSYIGVRPSRPKRDFLIKLIRDLGEADRSLVISMSNSSDPYPPEERLHKLTRRTLEILINRGFKVQIITKGALALRDVDLFERGRVCISVSFSTINDELSKKLEPGASSLRERLLLVEKLAKRGIPVSARVDPLIPRLNEGLEELVSILVNKGVNHITFSTYKARPDNFQRMVSAFPEFKNKWYEMYRRDGVRMHGYWYLSLNERVKLLKPLIEIAKREGITYATCREGLTSKEFFNAPTCDGTHLIK